MAIIIATIHKEQALDETIFPRMRIMYHCVVEPGFVTALIFDVHHAIATFLSETVSAVLVFV